jgi:hypothetical protein
MNREVQNKVPRGAGGANPLLTTGGSWLFNVENCRQGFANPVHRLNVSVSLTKFSYAALFGN